MEPTGTELPAWSPNLIPASTPFVIQVHTGMEETAQITIPADLMDAIKDITGALLLIVAYLNIDDEMIKKRIFIFLNLNSIY